MCSLSSSFWHTHLKLCTLAVLHTKAPFSPESTHTHKTRWQRGSVRLFLCPLYQTCTSWLRLAQVNRWECHWGAVAMASENGWVSRPVTVMKVRANGLPPPHWTLTTQWAQPGADNRFQEGVVSCGQDSQTAQLFCLIIIKNTTF